MKRFYYAIMLVCLTFAAIRCQKEVSYLNNADPSAGNNNPDPITATLQGNIIDEDGNPAMGVLITAGSKTATTDARGYFRITGAALDKNESMLMAEKAGYFKAFRTFGATRGANHVSIKLIRKTSAGTISAASGGSVALANGSAIALPANGIVTASGSPFTGSVNVFAAYIDPSSDEIAQIVPGSFLARDKDNKKVVLTSYGMLAVELASPAGEKLQVAPGSVATITTAIPAALQASAPATISLWYVDEQTGIWKEEGTATKTGSNYIGTVKHFTYWNCDVAGPTVSITASFKDQKGLPLVHVEVRLRPTGSYASAHGYTDSLGQINGPAPANTNLVLELMSPCYTVMYSKNIGSFSSNADLGTITLNADPSIITVQGILKNCNGAPVTDGYAIITYDNMIRYAGVNPLDGGFTTTFTTCAGMPASCDIVGVDMAAGQQGAVVNVNITSLTDAGNIVACGTSALQYINYTIDGVNYGHSSLVQGDQFSAQPYDSTGIAKGATIAGSSANRSIFFQFNDDGPGNTYQLTFLNTTISGASNLLTPFNISITNYAQAAGEFFEGSFSGEYKDSANISHSITCSFRVRKI